ncbi:hypothetical protein Dip510_001991 [Elusimicrobium posterum]|uniref:hypothetical protein n=1 Tax=Elusimicrobium posterum TaxID=3116653 RepID=UPI003C73D6B4
MSKAKQAVYLFFVEPFKNRGIFWGSLDLCLKVVSLALWLFVMRVVASLMFDAVFVEYNPGVRMWWFLFCFFQVVGASMLAYTGIFVRREKR